MKQTKYILAAALAVLALGCNREQVAVDGTPDGEEVAVTFAAELPGTITKAIGDGLTAKNLSVAVYDDASNAAGTHIVALDKTAVFDALHTTVEYSLVKGKTYHFIFWAQAEGAPYTFNPETKKVAIDYTGAANDESRDAFYAVKTLKVTGPATEPVQLHRPFAQVNFGTSDSAAATDAGVTPTASLFTATDAASSFDVFAGEGTDPVRISFTEATLPAERLTLKDGTSYTYLAMNYFIPAGKLNETHVSNLSATFKGASDDVVISVPSAKVQAKYRTNIVGNLLTDQVVFNVEIVPAFEDETTIDIENITTAADLRTALANGHSAKLAADITIDETISVPAGKDVILDLNGHEINNTEDLWNETTGDWSLVSVRGGSLTIKGDGILKAKENDCFAVDVQDGGHVIIEDGEYISNVHAVYVWVGTAEIRGGKYSVQQKFQDPAKADEFVLNCYDAHYRNGTAKIIVTGGEFVKFNPADCWAEGAHTNFLAPGYKTTKIGENYFVTKADVTPVANKAGFDDAVTAGSADQPMTVELHPNVTVELENGIANEGTKSRNLTVVGDGTQTFDVITKAISAEGGTLNYQRGSSFTFKNLTVQAGEGNFDGIVCDALTYENCTIKGKLTLYGKATFINCVFENTMANQYSIWTWGGTDVTFEDCTFNTNGKAILLYGQATATKPTNLTVSNCEFNDRNNGTANKAAIEIGNDYDATYNLVVNNITVNGFADGKNTGSKVWANKTSMDAAHLSVTIDGVKVL
ncbi:MAG: right-handed parallel beta-helix repeat-containing protein [Candidatus Cryptobacteroides sp.]|nr:right-handed parallel beta-helix repeat-containing protein [Bacteroidales bacterium]MDY2773566.1 right-handed parallel beta-helix repeat-containing protein [Candidatus Cryptobacteroides sp.]